jgi:predicted dinucleotide-binding enzyme
MNIAVLGTGVVGQTIADKLASLGHEVTIGTRDIEATLARDQPDTFGRPPFKAWHAEHPQVRLASFRDAAAAGELIVNATGGVGSLAALGLADRQNLEGKILIDISNPLDFSQGFPPLLTVSNTDSLGEQIQREYPGVKVVKTLNTMNAYLMVAPRLLPGSHNVFVSGNDAEAKRQVAELLQAFGWESEEIVDLGDISTARGTEQLLPMWSRLYGALPTPMFNFKIVVGEAPPAA